MKAGGHCRQVMVGRDLEVVVLSVQKKTMSTGKGHVGYYMYVVYMLQA
jgi:predicted DNA-binding protein with PD1-like motif